MNKEEQLINQYHAAIEKNDDREIIATSLHLAEFYYEQEDMHKAKHHLLRVKQKDDTIENLYLYLSLIEIYFDRISSAKQYLKKEIRHNPNNTYAKQLLEKLTISTNFPYATLIFSLLFVGVFLFFYPEMSFSQSLLYGFSQKNFSFFSVITSLVSHLNLLHLILNTILFLSLGSLVERHIGTLHFTLFFIISGIVANASQIILTHSQTIVLGASGGLFGIMGILLMQQPLLKLRLFGIIKIPVIILYGSLISLSLLFSTYLFGSAEIAHIIGLFAGILYAGIRYNETITVFYHWIIITFGFYFLIRLPEQIIVNSITPHSFLVSSSLFVLGLIMILYSYTKLKITFHSTSLRGDDDE